MPITDHPLFVGTCCFLSGLAVAGALHALLSARAPASEPEARRLQDFLAAERAGRVRAEKALRESVNRAVLDEGGGGYPLLPIGHIVSPFRGRWGTPRQGMLAPDARAHVVFNPAIPATALQGLAEYSHVYVLFLFHENSNMHKMAKPGRAEGLPAQTRAQRAAAGRRSAGAGAQEEDSTLTRLLRERHFSALIEPPAMKGARTGVLSTRSPHRPNAIGLSLCRLVAVHDSATGARMLVLSGCDLVAGTPVVDIKPFAPYDCPTCLGALVGAQPSPPAFAAARDLPAAVRNLAQGADLVCPDAYALRGPAWVYSTLQNQAAARLPVVWGPGTEEFVLAAVRGGRTRFYGAREAALLRPREGPREGAVVVGEEEEEVALSEARALLLAISQVLALDIRAVHHGRGGAPSETRGGAALRSTAASASANLPAVLRRMGLEGEQEDVVAAALAAAPPTVQYYELWYDVFDLKWTCVERGAEETQLWGDSGADADKKLFYARVDAVDFSEPPATVDTLNN